MKKINSYNGPDVWNNLLKIVTSSAYPKAVVAGGAVRDWFHGTALTPNDIDIFVGVRDELEFDMAFHDLPFDDKKQLTAQSSGYSQADVDEFEINILGGVIEIYPPQGCKINIIGKRMEAIEDVPGGLLSDFDHTLCDFWWDGEEVRRSQDAYAAFQSKRIEIKRQGLGKIRTLQRLRSLTRRQAYDKYTYDGKDAHKNASHYPSFLNSRYKTVEALRADFARIMAPPPAPPRAQVAPAFMPEWNVAANNMWEIRQ